jgi:glycosyltransferase involved in cell wall biosynthesis
MIYVTHIMAFSENSTGAVFSGAENHLFTLMKTQKDLGFQVELIMLIYQNGPVLEKKVAELKEYGIVVQLFLVPESGSLKMIRSAFLLCSYLRHHQSHIIHTHMDQADLAGKLASFFTGCKNVVSTFHNDEPYYGTLLWKLRLRVLDKLSKKQIVISQSIFRLLVDKVGINPDKLELIYYGVDQPLVNKSREEIREQYKIERNDFVVGFVGRLVPQKNLPVLLKALVAIPDVLGVVVGDGSHRQEYEQVVEELKIKNVLFLGFQQNGTQLISSFDVLCLPSQWEGFGLVVLEAMLLKIPVIGSQAGAIPELLENGKCGLIFNPDSPEDLIEKIRFAIQNPDAVRAIGELAYHRAINTFTTNTMVSKISNLYQQILSGKKLKERCGDGEWVE